MLRFAYVGLAFWFFFLSHFFFFFFDGLDGKVCEKITNEVYPLRSLTIPYLNLPPGSDQSAHQKRTPHVV